MADLKKTTFLLITGLLSLTVFISISHAQPIVSCNATGDETNTFYTNKTVYVESSTNITTSATPVGIYIVNDSNSWANGTVLNDVSGGNETNTTNSSGYLELTRIWSPILTIGEYDIVVDVNRDGVYNSTVDFVDNLTTTGFEVIAVPVPTLDIDVGPNSPPNHNWNLTDSDYNVMLQLELTAGPVEDVKINSMAIAASGTGDDKNGVQVIRLILDENGNGVYDQGESLLAFGQYIRDDAFATLDIQNGEYVIPVNKTVYIIIIYTMSGSSSDGDTYKFEADSISAVGATTGAQVKIIGLPVGSALKTIVAQGITSTTTTTSSTTSSSSTTLTTISSTTSTTTSTPPPQVESSWIYVILIVALLCSIPIFLVIFFSRKRRSHTGFEELKGKWSEH